MNWRDYDTKKAPLISFATYAKAYATYTPSWAGKSGTQSVAGVRSEHAKPKSQIPG